MANTKPLTEEKFIAVLKGFKKDFRKEIRHDLDLLRKELNEDFLETLANYHSGEIIPRLEEIKYKLDDLEQRLKWIKKDIKNMNAEYATNTVSKKDFLNLRKEVLSIQEELDGIKSRIGLTK